MFTTLDLSPNFRPLLHKAPSIIPTKQWGFNAGERGLQLNAKRIEICDEIIITHQLSSSDKIMEVLLAVDAIRRINPQIRLKLFIPYIPYARQDRVMEPGEPLSIAVFASLINSCGFTQVMYMTPHSDVSKALINNGHELDDFPFIKQVVNIGLGGMDNLILCSPDAGAMKRTFKTAYHLGYKDRIAVGSKVRDVSNGNILESRVDVDDFGGKNVLIIDDIVEYGKTFTELAKVIKQRNCGKIYLCVTHGSLPDGAIESLSTELDGLFVTDSFKTVEETEFVTQIKLNSLIL